MTRKEIVVFLLERLIRERHLEMVRFAFGLTRNLFVAEDLAQEAYRRVLLNWRVYDRRFAFSSWCSVIIRHLHIDRCRSKSTHFLSLDHLVLCNGDGLLPQGHMLPAAEIPVLDLMVGREEKDAARKAYSSLGPLQKAVVRLLAEDGLKYQQVARRLNIPVGTVRSRLHRARKSARCQYP